MRDRARVESGWKAPGSFAGEGGATHSCTNRGDDGTGLGGVGFDLRAGGSVKLVTFAICSGFVTRSRDM
jgi:hypothetical protein